MCEVLFDVSFITKTVMELTVVSQFVDERLSTVPSEVTLRFFFFPSVDCLIPSAVCVRVSQLFHSDSFARFNRSPGNMSRQDQHSYKSRIQEVMPSTRFGQGKFHRCCLPIRTESWKTVLFSLGITLLFKTTQKTG